MGIDTRARVQVGHVGTGRRFAALSLAVLIIGTTVAFMGCSTLDGQSSFGPVITGLSPASGKVGSKVEIHGTSFGPLFGEVEFVDRNRTAVKASLFSWTDTLVVVEVPALPSGVQTATVNLLSSAFAPMENPSTFTITSN
jgi:hypothetical protein